MKRGAWCVVRGVATALGFALLAPTTAAAQGGGMAPNPPESLNVRYDGRFTFVRIHFEPLGGGGMWRRDLKWDHDYPRAERHFTKILSEITSLRPNLTASNILSFADPEVLKYPVAYVSEPGFWMPTDKEAEGLRNYLLKGGFVIFDDFVGPQHWYVFTNAMRKVLPQSRLVPIDDSHPIFDSFYRIENLASIQSTYGIQPQYWGAFEDNDPKKRLLFIANLNSDLGDYWEWSDAGFFPIQLSNEAYKLGVNYVIYGMTR